MRAAASVLGLVIVLAVGCWVYRAELVSSAPAGTSTIVDQADVVGVKADLLSIGESERQYLAGHDGYATLDQLREEGSVQFSSRHGYDFRVDPEGPQHFKAVATPAAGHPAVWPTFAMDESMQITGPGVSP